MYATQRFRRRRALRLLLSGDLDVMAKGADGLVGLEARDELRAALRNRDPYVREFAAAALKRVATDDDLPRYVSLLDDRELLIADAAQTYLASVGERALPLVAERVQRDPKTVLLEAVELLGQFGDEDGVPALEAVVVHGNASQRDTALDALARVGGAQARRIVEKVKRVTADEDEREHAVHLLEAWA